jgi:hypothetical protein
MVGFEILYNILNVSQLANACKIAAKLYKLENILTKASCDNAVSTTCQQDVSSKGL